jgi:predicted nucleic acid-binding protein
MARVARRVVDASPLILLGKIGRLELLRVGGPEVIVPDAVRVEILAHGPDDAALEIAASSWMRVAPPIPIPAAVQAWDLGAGESLVLALALEDRDSEVVLDDRDARRCAQALGVQTRGTLGLVLLAKQLGEVAAARPLVNQLKSSDKTSG